MTDSFQTLQVSSRTDYFGSNSCYNSAKLRMTDRQILQAQLYQHEKHLKIQCHTQDSFSLVFSDVLILIKPFCDLKKKKKKISLRVYLKPFAKISSKSIKILLMIFRVSRDHH